MAEPLALERLPAPCLAPAVGLRHPLQPSTSVSSGVDLCDVVALCALSHDTLVFVIPSFRLHLESVGPQMGPVALILKSLGISEVGTFIPLRSRTFLFLLILLLQQQLQEAQPFGNGLECFHSVDDVGHDEVLT